MSLALAPHTQTLPRSKLRLTITFLATEEHGSRASPELKSDWRRKLQPHRDLQGEGHGGGMWRQEQRRQGHSGPLWGWGLASHRNTEAIPQTPTTHTSRVPWTSLCSQPPGPSDRSGLCRRKMRI